MKRKLYYLSILLVLLSYPLISQENTVSGGDINQEEKSKAVDMRVKELKAKPLNIFFGLTFSNTVPQNDYMTNVRQAAPGFGLNGGYRFDPFPVTVGMEMDFHFFEAKMHTYSYKLPNDWTYARDTLHTSSFNMPITIFARIEPHIFHTVFPYIEGVGGINIMIVNANYTTFNGTEDDKDESGVNFLYGAGAGMMIKIADFVQLPDKNSRLLLDLNFRYLWSTCSDYYTVKVNSDASVTFNKFSSPTDQLMFNAGIIFHF